MNPVKRILGDRYSKNKELDEFEERFKSKKDKDNYYKNPKNYWRCYNCSQLHQTIVHNYIKKVGLAKIFSVDNDSRIVVAWDYEGNTHFVSITLEADFVKVHNGEQEVIIRFDNNVPIHSH